MRSHHRTRYRVAATLLAAMAASTVVTACGDDPKAAETTGAAASGSASTTANGCTTPPQTKAKDQALTLPSKAAAEGKTFIASMKTNCGTITMELDGTKAPQTVASFSQLAKSYYDDTPCHRLVPDFVLQCGDPTGTGTGGPGYTFGLENAPSDDQYPRGTLAMARQGENGNSNGGQFFITLTDTSIPSDSAGGYSIFGKVVGGMDVVDRVAAQGVGDDGTAPKQPISLLKITVTEKKA